MATHGGSVLLGKKVDLLTTVYGDKTPRFSGHKWCALLVSPNSWQLRSFASRIGQGTK